MTSHCGLPTPPPLNAAEYKEYFANALRQNIPNNDGTPSAPRYERKMGDTELSYFLPSRQSGVNDMYLHLGFKVPEHLVHHARVRTVWAILRLRHPLLCANVQMHDYDDVRFIYDAPTSVEDLLDNANRNLEFRSQTKDELIDTYLNGPRTLSTSRLSYLIISQPDKSRFPTPPRTPSPSQDAYCADLASMNEQTSSPSQFEYMICAMHCLGDGMALHQVSNDFFGLLGGEKSDDELMVMLRHEWHTRWGAERPVLGHIPVLPCALEDGLALSSHSTCLQRVARQVDFQLSQASLVGGQTFPRRKHPERQTLVPTVAYPPDRTIAILKRCKANGVSISAALFAICNVAWARVGGGSLHLPTMMYSALNLRPYFRSPTKTSSEAEEQERLLRESYWFLAIGYFNVILPNFIPASPDEQAKAFWHRARQAKKQSTEAAKSKMVASRTREMGRERAERAIAWGKEDDQKENGTWVPPTSPAPGTAAPSVKDILPARERSPSAALLGLSLLGNLDGMYSHSTFPEIKLHTLTTGSRQRNGAMLLFGYTFAGKLWISLGYDCNGFKEGIVESFWTEINHCVDEFLG